MSNQQLPCEILESIFRVVVLHSDNNFDLLNCALVCQAWHLPACYVLYERVQLKNLPNILFCLSQQRENKGIYTKLLQFAAAFDSRPSSEYEQLFSFLPNLETIKLEFCWSRRYHLKQIAKHRKLLQHIKEISFVDEDEFPGDLEAYYDCILAFNNTYSV